METNTTKIPLVVDFGLPSGTLWANMNVGAENESDAGLFLAWGESEQKDGYFLSNYKFWQNIKVGEHEEVIIEKHTELVHKIDSETGEPLYQKEYHPIMEDIQAVDEDGNPVFDEDGNPVMTQKQKVDEDGNPLFDIVNVPIMEEKIIEDEKTIIVEDYEQKMIKYNKEDGKMILDNDDDPATIILGDEFQTPTKDQWQELFDNCDYHVEMQSIRFSRNGQTMILPRCGVMTEDFKPEDNPDRCNYWSKSRDKRDTNAIRAIVDVNGDRATLYTDWENRIVGMPIRAIKMMSNN